MGFDYLFTIDLAYVAVSVRTELHMPLSVCVKFHRGYDLCGLKRLDERYFDREGAVGIADDDVLLAQHLIAFPEVGQSEA